LSDARIAKGTGMMREYNASFDKTWEAAKCSCNTLGLPIAGDNKAEGYILAQKGMSAVSYGENIAVFVKGTAPNKTTVEAVSKKALKTNVFATNWEPKILNGIDACLSSK
jgi:hypothetical protein